MTLPLPDETPVGPPDPGRRTHPLTPLVSSWIAVVAVGFILVRELLEGSLDLDRLRESGTWLFLGGIALVVLVVSVGTAFLTWRATRYRLDPDGLTIERKLVSHETKRLLYRRIQSVEINQPLAARFLGLSRITIDVGGDGSSRLGYLTRQQAEDLRHDLLRRAVHARSAAEQGPQPSPLPPAPTAAAVSGIGQRVNDLLMHSGDDLAAFEKPRTLLVQVRPQTLVIGAVTSAEFVMTLVVLGVFGLVRAITGYSFTLGFAIPFLIPLAGFVFNRVVKEWRFRVETDGEGLRISHGMTDLTTHSTPRDRVHGFALEQPLLWRPLGLWRVRMTVLGKAAGDEDEQSNDVALAIGTWAEANRVITEVWPGLDLERVPLNPVPRRARWFLWWAQKAHAWALTDDFAVTRSGMLTRRLHVADHPRAQSIRLDQGPLDRRLDLASVTIDLVDGPVRLRFAHLDPDDARRLVMTQPVLARAVRRRRAESGSTPANPGVQRGPSLS